ncbi:MAG: hypothetical protein LC131_00255 [Anaerolineae bacterium]|nr:hypothetical protein [Anaerolineae bacterium]
MYGEIDQITIDVLKEFGTIFYASRTGSTGTVENLNFTGIQVDQVVEEMPNSGIQIGDWRMLLVSTIEPKKGDRIALNGGVHTIMKTQEIAPAKVVIGYWAWARIG